MIGLDVQRVTDHLTGRIGYQITLTPPDASPVSLILTPEQWRAFAIAAVASFSMPPDAARPMVGPPI